VEYAGTAYAGFQRQPNEETVQGVLEKAIGSVTGEEITITAAGRTDAGAHAVHQVIAFTTASQLPAETFTRAFNAHLPADVVVSRSCDVPDDFHPRFDALSRTYRYIIWNRRFRSPLLLERAVHIHIPLDASRMHRALQYLVGEHDFGAFAGSQAEGSRVRRMLSARCWREEHLIRVELQADGFLKQMVRSIAGTLIDIGKGTREPEDMEAILASRDREQAGETAPAWGLYLMNVEYPAHAVEI
jgi:tRNA pseudouridine38-40 synthase